MQLVGDLDEANVKSFISTLASRQDASSQMLHMLLLTRWASINPRPAVDYALAMEHEGLRALAIAATFTPWAEHEPEAAFRFVSTMPASKSRQYAASVTLQSALQSALQSDTTQGVALANQYLNAEEKQMLSHQINLAVARQSPQKAAESALLLSDRSSREAALSPAMQEWAKVDRPAALAWAQALVNNNDRERAVNSVIIAWSKTTPNEAAAFTMNLSAGQRRDSLIQDIIQNWVELDAPAARTWVTALPDSRSKACAMEPIVSNLVRRDSKAASIFAQTAPRSWLTDASKIRLTSALAKYDLPDAIGWLQSRMPELDETLILELIASDWMADGSVAAANRAAEIKDPRQRQIALDKIISTWTHHDPTSAKNWINQSPLPAESKEKLLSGK